MDPFPGHTDPGVFRVGGGGGRGFWRLSQTRELKMRVSDTTLCIKRWYPPKRDIVSNFPRSCPLSVTDYTVTYVDILS